MNKANITLTLVAGILLLATGLQAQGNTTAQPATTQTATSSPFTTDKEKASYALGTEVANNLLKNLERSDIELDKALVLRGFQDALNKLKLQMTDAEIKDAIGKISQEARTRGEAKAKAIAEFNKVQGEEFLKDNKTKPGVTTLSDGLQYKVITLGTGPTPTAADTVEVNYRGTLVDGKEFDSSTKHGGPAVFPISRVIKGWTEILQLMPVGSRYQVFIPSELAYGPRSSGPDIGPNAALIFEIELLSIKTTEAQPQAVKPLTPPPPPPDAPPAK